MRWEWSYEKDETHTELFGVDDQWIKKIYFDRQGLSAQEVEQYPDPKKPPPWIDSGAGKPTKVAADIVGPEVCKNGGWMLADDDPVLRIRLLYHGLESRAEEGSWYMFGVDASLGLMLVLKEEDGWDVLVEVYAQDMCRCVLGWGSCDACSLCNIMCCAPRRGLEGAHLSGATFVGHST